MLAEKEIRQQENQKTLFNLFGGRFAGFQLGHRKTKRYMTKSAVDIIDYLNEWFSGQTKDSGFFKLDKIMFESEYSENAVRIALKQINQKQVFLIKDLGNKNFLIMINKIENKIYMERVESGEIIIENYLKSIDKTSGFNKVITNVKKIFSAQATELPAQATELPAQATELTHTNKTQDISAFQTSANSSLDLSYSLDLSFNRSSSSLKEITNPKFKAPIGEISETKNKNDDDFLKNKLSEEKNELEDEEAKILCAKLKKKWDEDKKNDSDSSPIKLEVKETEPDNQIGNEKISGGVSGDFGHDVDELKVIAKQKLLDNGIKGNNLNLILSNPDYLSRVDLAIKILKIELNKKEVKNPAGLLYIILTDFTYTIPYELQVDIHQEKIQENKGMWDKLCDSIGAQSLSTWSSIQTFINECRNLTKDDEQLWDEFYKIRYDLLIIAYKDNEQYVIEKSMAYADDKLLKARAAWNKRITKILNLCNIGEEPNSRNIHTLIDKSIKILSERYQTIIV